MAGAPQEFRSVGVHSGLQHGVLVCLRSGQFQRLVLVLQTADVVLVQGIEDGTGIGVLIVNDVPRGVLDGVLRSRSTGGDVVPHALDRILDASGLGCHVVVHAVDCAGIIAAIMLSQKLFIFCFSRFPREFRLYLHPPFLVGVGHSCWDYWYPSSPISR